jgi:hypothetical protein
VVVEYFQRDYVGWHSEDMFEVLLLVFLYFLSYNEYNVLSTEILWIIAAVFIAFGILLVSWLPRLRCVKVLNYSGKTRCLRNQNVHHCFPLELTLS